jgi:hypothetical protein
MTRRHLTRLLLLSLLSVAAIATAGCGNKVETQTLGETEGIYVDVADLKYQVQLSRILNPNDIEDRQYLRGLAPGVAQPARGEAWFAVFMRVSNPTPEAGQVATDFTITDTQETEFKPVQIDNPFSYKSDPLRPGAVFPDGNSIMGEGDIGGGLILFKLSLTSLANRPLELKIDPPAAAPQAAQGIIDLDV